MGPTRLSYFEPCGSWTEVSLQFLRATFISGNNAQN
jgi:hypothetical protein